MHSAKFPGPHKFDCVACLHAGETIEAYNKAMERPIPEWGKTLPEFLEFIAANLERNGGRGGWVDCTAVDLRKHAVLLKKAMILATGDDFIIDVCMTCKIEYDVKPGKPVNGMNISHGYCPPCATKAEKEFKLTPKEGA
jgi:hypothetical protein